RLSLLANSLNHFAAFQVHRGAFSTAAVLIDEVDAITHATGIAPLKYSAAKLVAAQGDRARWQAFANFAFENAGARGEGSAFGGAWCFSALVYNSHGQYDKALAAAQKACEHEEALVYGPALVELVEAGVRVGAMREASMALEHLRERTGPCGTEWALGVEARCR